MSAEMENGSRNVQTFSDPWQAANHLTDGAVITVRYESKQSDKVMEKSGEVENVIAPSPDTKERHDLDYDLRIDFEREDGQRMYVFDSGELHTAMSMYPLVGEIVEIEVVNGIQNPVTPPEEAQSAFERSLIAAEREQMSKRNPSDLDILEAALNKLSEEDVTPKEDWSDDKFTNWMKSLSDRTQLDFDE